MTEDAANDERPVISLYHALLDRWNARDAVGMTSLVSPDGYIVGFDGSQLNGPAEIEATLREIFASHPTPPYVTKVRAVRFLSDGVAVLRAVVGMVPPGKKDLDPALNAVQTMVAERIDNQWRVAVLQNTPAAFHGRPELVEKLTRELSEALGQRN